MKNRRLAVPALYAFTAVFVAVVVYAYLCQAGYRKLLNAVTLVAIVVYADSAYHSLRDSGE